MGEQQRSVQGPLIQDRTVRAARASWARFTTDGTSFQYNYDNVNLAVGADVIINPNIPEPSAIGMLLLGSIGLVGFRRSALRRLFA